ncbi:MAG: pyridoxal phosphate-dependent aminotransferase [Thermoplasmata archaeon]
MKEDPFVYAHKKEDEIVWMSQNTNQLDTTDKIEEKIIETVEKKKYNLYPHKQGILGLRETLLQDLGLEENFEALITNGAIEATYGMTRALIESGDNVIATDPSFLPIHKQVELSGGEMREIAVYKPPYKMTVEEIKERVDEDTEMILLIDPLNPLGSSYDKEEVKAICDIAEDEDLLMIDDITYRDFAYDHTLTTEYVPERTLLVYSFSKNVGFAGMRLGALIMPEEYSEVIHEYRTNVLSANVLAQVGAKTALETKDEWIDDMVEQARKNQKLIKECVEDIEGLFLPVYPSHTNMFAIDIAETGIRPEDLQEKLLYEHDVFVRSGTYVSKNAGEDFIRVSFTVPEKGVRRFTDVLPGVIEELR